MTHDNTADDTPGATVAAGAAASELAAEIRRLRTAAGLSQNQLAAQIGYTRQYVSLAERTGGNLPSSELTRALDAHLNANGRLLALREQARTNQRQRRAPSGRGGNRTAPAAPSGASSLVSATTTMYGHDDRFDRGAAQADFLASLTLAVRPPQRIGSTEVEQVKLMTSTLAASENLYGGGLAGEAGAAHLRWTGQLLSARASNDVATAMFEAVGNLAGVVAFSAFDIGEQDAAAKCFRFGLWCAEQAGSWELRAATLADMARQAIHLGDLDDALSLIEFAHVRADRLTYTTRAMIGVVRARLLALLGRHDETRAEVDRADSYFAHRQPDGDPPWLIYYDEAEHAGTSARALAPLAVAENDPGEAAERLSAAIRLHSDAYPRSKAFSTTRLATLHMMTGDPREAALLGRQAITDASTLRSRRMDDEIATLVRASQRHRAVPDVADLLEFAGTDAVDA